MDCPKCYADMRHVDHEINGSIHQDWWCPFCHYGTKLKVSLPIPRVIT